MPSCVNALAALGCVNALELGLGCVNALAVSLGCVDALAVALGRVNAVARLPARFRCCTTQAALTQLQAAANALALPKHLLLRCCAALALPQLR
jgi:hypothetical protein